MDMHCEELPGPLHHADFIKEEPVSEDEAQSSNSDRTATITGIYMNQSTGLSKLSNRIAPVKDTTEPEAAENRELKLDPSAEEKYSSSESAPSDIDGIYCLPEEELRLLKHRAKSKNKRIKEKTSKSRKHDENYNTLNGDNDFSRHVPNNNVTLEIKRRRITGIKENQHNEDIRRKRSKREKRLECDYCNEFCSSAQDRDAHIREAHPGYDGLFVCIPCNKSFNGRRQLRNHKNTEHKQTEYTCTCCDSKFVNKLSFKRHMLTHTGNPLYVCNYCGKSNFIAKADMERHIRSIHTKEKPYVCKYDGCDKRFPSSGCRSKHYVTHTGERKHECEYCGIKMQRTSDLRQHIRRHTGEKPFQCTICGMAFTRSYRLKMHRLVIHEVDEFGERVERKKQTSEDKPHQCETCGKRFCDKTNLQRHYATHTNDRAYVCETCGSAFNFESNLQRHVQTVHLGKFSHSCPTCGVGCRDKDDFERHMAKHTGFRKYNCPTCNKSFYTKDALSGHIRSVHQAIRSSCSICGSSFKEIRSHQNHMVKVHKMDQDQVAQEIENAKRYKRMQADSQEKPIVEAGDDQHSKQVYFNCDICKRDLMSIKSLPKHYIKVHKLSKEDAETRAREEEKRKLTAVNEQTVQATDELDFPSAIEIPSSEALVQGPSLMLEETTASKMIPNFFPMSEVSASAIAQAYLMSCRTPFDV